MGANNAALLAKLSYPGGTLPEDALDEALHRYNEIRHELYAAMRLAPDKVNALETEHNGEYSLKFFAMYLAAEKGDAEAFAPIHEYFSTYGEKAWKYLGKMTSGNLVQVLTEISSVDSRKMRKGVPLDGMDAHARIAFIDVFGMHENYL